MRETVRYWGETEAERRAAFRADATARAAAGWQVVNEVTDWPVGRPGLDLVVTYELADPAADREPAGASLTSAGREPARRGRGSLISIVWQKLPYLGLLAFFVAIVNFVWFFVESTTVGDALNGYEQAGHYFVLLKPGYREVSQATWDWLRFHGASVFVTQVLGIAGGAWYSFRLVFPRMIEGRRTPREASRRADMIRQSGPLMASARSGGNVGSLRMSGPLLKVSVYPAGIIVKPVFMAEHAVLAQEITSVTSRRSWGSQVVEIEHSGVDVKSPLVIYAKADSAILSAIKWIASPNGQPVQKSPFVWPKSVREVSSRVFAPATVRTTGRPIVVAVSQLADLAWSAMFVIFGLVVTLWLPNPFFVIWTGVAVVLFVKNLRGILASRRRAG